MKKAWRGIDLETPVRYLKGVGPKMAQRLKRLEIITVKDLLYHFPFRWQNYSLLTPINLIQEGETVTVLGEIKAIKNQFSHQGKKIQKAVIEDKSGRIKAIWFNQPFLVQHLSPGKRVFLAGKVALFAGEKYLVSPDWEPAESPFSKYKTIHTGRLVPIYPETKSISSKYLRKLIAQVLPLVKEKIEELVPLPLIIKNNLLPEREAIEKIHFPENKTAAKKAKEKLAFEEMFLIQLKLQQRKALWQQGKKAPAMKIDRKKIKAIKNSLPFSLTRAQEKVLKEISADLSRSYPMNRLLQGDVGSGKTIVAALAAYIAFLNQYQTIIMAPTEILAWQHYLTLKNIFTPYALKIALLTGKQKKAKKKELKNYHLIVGTHALLHYKDNFGPVGLVVIDEQHRFGVSQRAALIDKAGWGRGFFPHLLTMTATPIPRTISLTLHGDLDLSFLDELPPGRKGIKTKLVLPHEREKKYHWIKKQIKEKKQQAFVVCPLIEPSETLQTVKAAKAEFTRLKKEVFSDLRLGLLHGRMKTKEKETVLKQMKEGKIDILVATPVVEVGIDIARATIIIIEGAERFGLAQLHQLRGRIGRRQEEGFCFLITEKPTPKALSRLKAMETINQGIKLAEIDLKMRGPGELYGLRQHGFPKLKIASLADINLIEKTREAAQEIINLDPKLKNYLRLRKIIEEKEKPIAPN